MAVASVVYLARLPSWTGGVDPDRAKRVSGDGVVDVPKCECYLKLNTLPLPDSLALLDAGMKYLSRRGVFEKPCHPEQSKKKRTHRENIKP
jgi:hypothetical protein